MKNIKPYQVIYCDMDGVIANFDKEPKAVERFKVEKGFFFNLEPIKENVQAVLSLIEKGFTVKILTTSPHKQADKDKKAWLEKVFKGYPLDVICGRPHTPKIDYIRKSQRKNSILFDDYGKNIREWLSGGGGGAYKVSPSKPISKYMKGVLSWDITWKHCFGIFAKVNGCQVVQPFADGFWKTRAWLTSALVVVSVMSGKAYR